MPANPNPREIVRATRRRASARPPTRVSGYLLSAIISVIVMKEFYINLQLKVGNDRPAARVADRPEPQSNVGIPLPKPILPAGSSRDGGRNAERHPLVHPAILRKESRWSFPNQEQSVEDVLPEIAL